MSEWTEDQLEDMLNMLRDYGASCEYDGYRTGYDEGYNMALADAVEAAQRVSVG
jgi:valyl-tRNA synthetase